MSTPTRASVEQQLAKLYEQYYLSCLELDWARTERERQRAATKLKAARRTAFELVRRHNLPSEQAMQGFYPVSTDRQGSA